MMKLLGSSRSPYVRKVRVMFEEKGIAYVFAEVSASDPEVAQANPLAKIPALVCDNGKFLYDSCVIVEYLDGLVATPKLIPDAFEARIDVKRWEALGNGIMDAIVEISHEERTPIAQRKGPEFFAKQQKKIDASLATMEKDLDDREFCHGDSLTLADIACGSAGLSGSRTAQNGMAQDQSWASSTGRKAGCERVIQKDVTLGVSTARIGVFTWAGPKDGAIGRPA